MDRLRRRIATLGLLGIGALWVTDGATGAVVLVTSEASFQAATSGLTTIDFADHTDGTPLTDYSTPAGLSVGPVTFVGETIGGGNFLHVIRPDYFPTYDVRPPGASPTVLGGPSGGGPATAVGYLDVMLGGAYSAVGSGLYVIDEINLGGPAGQIEVLVTDLSGTYGFTIDTPAAPEIGFAGFLSDSTITALRYTGVGAAIYPELSDFEYGFNVVPEPSSLMLGSIGGVVGLGIWWRRRG